MDENIYQNFQDQNYPGQGVTMSLSYSEIKSLSGWATFRAILDIISGALSCLGIITAVYGVPLIIAGIKLLNSVDQLKGYMATNDTQRITETLRSMQKYFKLNGISTIVRICFYIIIMVLYIGLIVYIISRTGGFINNMPNMYDF